MRRNNWLLCFSFLIITFCFSQNKTNKIPLTDFLKSIENNFDVKFSYAVEDVANVFITKPNTELNLANTIQYLNANTLLNFKTLDNRYITVSVIDKTITVCGIIQTDQQDPLYGASVIIKDTTNGTSTNYQGKFELENIPLEAIISISYLGFETKIISAKSLFTDVNECQPIVLLENKQELNEVLITRYLTTGLQKLIDGSIVLNTENFGVLPGLTEPDVLQSIQVLPGIESVNESIANINVRGGTNDQNLMIWDGIKMYHSGHFFGLISAYNPNLTNKVVVTKNGTSSQFSDGVSSTINMLTKDELSNTFSAGTGVNLISADAFLNIPISKKIELLVSGRRSLTDAFKTPTYNNYFERSFQDSDINTSSNQENSTSSSDFFFYDYSAKLIYDISNNHKFRANVIGINNNLDYSESSTNTSDLSTTKTSNLSQQNLGVGANWQAHWSDNFSTNLSGFMSQYNVDASDLRVENNQLLVQANEVLETGIKLNTTLKLSDKLTVLSGYQFNEIGILNQTTVTAPSYERTKKDVLLNHALYTEAEFNNNNTYFRLGVRANYFEKFDKLILEPRVNIRQKLSHKLSLKAEGEFKNQSATQIVDFQDDFLGVENRRWILADNQSIPISTSQQGSFGMAFNQNNLNIDVTGFYKHVNGITASNQGFYNNFQYLKATGDYTAKGVEFLINKTANNYSTWISYTYSINNYKFESFTPSIFPNNVDIRHSVSVAGNYNIFDDLEISVGAIWHSGQPYTKPVEGNETVETGNNYYVNYDAPNSFNLDPFFRLDASLSYTFKLSGDVKTALRVGVRNITNQQNVINRYYKVDPNDNQNTIEVNNTSLSLTPNASLRINF
ncbi:TonB-dependent receptor [Olleya aquimaris]|uniref:Outer membrane receptor for ferrienterochelin and colicin n=1 Tax=Olleya aquimaris TaxID=639310 RepID=A0A327R986_9FLAO|nr:TonB-dependent receptor [Olleya aquimaris]RAJ13496.1 outer membrane receptor for ferrienterochelin and colicin [Olleya aquimaris]